MIRRTLGALRPGQWLLAVACAAVAVPAPAQEVPDERGSVAVGLRLRELDGAKRVLVVGAHPDDEDTSLLATLARGMGARTAYLALTRGDGGQNLIGPELGEGLGVVRTGELLAARELDGAVQFFTRAFDFGYSKNADETLAHWPREELLRDVVWVVRSFRPQVVVSIFSGTPQDGHGQHQVAGLMAREAFAAAGDPDRFPDQLDAGVEAWQPRKLYQLVRGRRFFGNQEPPEGSDVVIQSGSYDPLLGRSYFQLAMASRSQHRSQDMGVAQLSGPRVSGFRRVDEPRPQGSGLESSMFEGVDTALTSLAAEVPAALRSGFTGLLESYRAGLARARESLRVLSPGDAAPHLAGMVADLVAARKLLGAAAPAAVSAVLDRRHELASQALLASSSVTLEVRVDDDLVVPGQEVGVDVHLWNGGAFAVEEAAPWLAVPKGWLVRPAGDDSGNDGGAVDPGTLRRWSFTVTVPEDAESSEVYYLEQPRDGDLYRWPDDPALRARPRNPALVTGSVELDLIVGARSLTLRPARDAEYVGVNKAEGEFRQPLLVVPGLSVDVEPRSMAWPLARTEPRTVTVVLRNQRERAAAGTVSLEAPPGWSVEPAAIDFDLAQPGADGAFRFQVRPVAGLAAGRHSLRAVARTRGGQRYDTATELVDYPHIRRVALFRPAETEISAFPVRVAQGLKVGYIMGSGDSGFEAIRQMGVDADLLGPEEVQSGDFGRFDAIVLGVRAYETRPDLASANERLLDFARQGGTVLVQYNKYEFPRGGFAPYPVEMSRPHDRVTDETAAVELLAPRAPVFTSPNRITSEDFQGWVQERGLYFLGQWDERYRPLLSMADPGEEPKRGALVVAPLGEGVYVYTGLSFFRQFPAGVPGAYRLFANLISLTAAEWRSFAADSQGGP